MIGVTIQKIFWKSLKNRKRTGKYISRLLMQYEFHIVQYDYKTDNKNQVKSLIG